MQVHKKALATFLHPSSLDMHAKRRPLISLPCRDPVTLAHAHLPLTPGTYKLHELLTASVTYT